MEVALVVLDGWGLGPDDDPEHRNAVAAAHTPNFDAYREAGASGQLAAAGAAVGLPDGQASNSEVGHVNIGAGRVVKQPYTRIDEAIADGSFGDNDALDAAFEYAADHGGRVHFLGLVSDGGVHSDQRHLYALIESAARRDADAVTHAFTDGRDASPTGGVEYLRQLEDVVADHGGTGRVATVVGRYYAMDRDENWERTHRAYRAIVDREGERVVDSPVAAVRESYARDVTDEFVEPTLVAGEPGIRDGDAAVFFNFRGDRSRQLTRMLVDIDPVWEFDTDPPEVRLVTMTEYDETFDLPVAFPPLELANTLGQVLADEGLTQLRAAESEKYAHVTYFLNGGREVAFEGERREIVPSPDVPTYDERPEMSARALTDRTIDRIDADDPDVLILNYSNPDMVAHTGNMEAAVEAVEAVDHELGRLVDALDAVGAHVVLTTDHGTADDMGTPDDPDTAHTANPVPFVYLAPGGGDGGFTVRDGGALADVAPTLLSLLGVEKPAEMTGESLLVRE